MLFLPDFVIPWDIRGYHLPIAWFTAESFARWELPLWDPSVYCGRPLYANLTAQLFYPPTVVAIAIYNALGLGSSEALLYVLEWQLVLHVFAGGCFAYLLGRQLGMDMAGALVCGSAFQLGAFFSSQAQHLGAVNAACWLPLVWLLTLRRKWAPLVLALAMVFLAGFPAVTSAVFGAALVLAVFRRDLKLVAGVLAAIAASLALSAVQLLPTLELSRLSVASYRADWMGAGGGMPLASLVSLVAPDYYGLFDLKSYRYPHEVSQMYTYSGLTALALAAWALWRRAAGAAMFAPLLAVFALWMLGASTPVGAMVFGLLPAFVKSSVYLEFALVAFSLSLAVMAGLGAWQLPGKWKALAVVAVAADLIAVSSGRPFNTARESAEPGIGDSHVDGREEITRVMRQLTGQATPPFRIDTMEESMGWAMGAPLTAVPTASGNDPFALNSFMEARREFVKGERWGRYYEVADLTAPMLDFMNVRYVLSRREWDAALLERAHFRRVRDLPGRIVYENMEVMPRFFLEGGTVRVISYAANGFTLETETPRPSTLISSEAAYPGWRAWVDGREAPLLTVRKAFRAVEAPAGKHRVEMRFEPRVLRWGALISALTAVLLVIFWRRGR